MRLRLSSDPGVYGTLIAADGRTIAVMDSDEEEGVRIVPAPNSSHEFIIFVSKNTKQQLDDLSPQGFDVYRGALLRIGELLFA